METVDSAELGFENSGRSHFECSSSGICTPLPPEKIPRVTVEFEPIYNPCSGVSSFVNGNWDSFVSLSQSSEARVTPIASLGHINGISNLHQSPSDHSFTEFVPNSSHREVFEPDNFLIFHEWQQICNSGFTPDYSIQRSGEEITLTPASDCGQSQEECQIMHVGSTNTFPNGKKRKMALAEGLQFTHSKGKDIGREQETDEFAVDQNEGKLKPWENRVPPSIPGKLLAKQIINSSESREAPKENHINVRAKRGRSISSHSLAERLRRERISERMKFLQDIVPGCNKITGKAVMLDEIINYVLSLQHQVEFLSMKLATVCPERNLDFDQFPSRNIYHSQGGRAAILGDLGNSSFYSVWNETSQGALAATGNSNLKVSAMPQASIWNELPSPSQIVLVPDPVSANFESDGWTEMEA